MKSITLKYNALGRYDDVSPFIITDGKIELRISLPKLSGEYFFIADNGGELIKLPITEAPFVVDGLKAGELRAEVKHYLKGELIKIYKIETLLLKELDCSISAEPEIAYLKSNIEELHKELSNYKSEAEEREQKFNKDFEEYKFAAKEHATELTAHIAALVRFAFTDYNNSPYQKGGDFNSFCNEFGFEFENKQPTEEKENVED